MLKRLPTFTECDRFQWGLDDWVGLARDYRRVFVLLRFARYELGDVGGSYVGRRLRLFRPTYLDDLLAKQVFHFPISEV